MQPRMNSPAMTLPGAMDSLMALEKSIEHCGVPRATLELMNMRASQINGCSVCVDLLSVPGGKLPIFPMRSARLLH